MKIEEAFARYLGQEVLVYKVSQGGSLSSVIDCTLEEIGDGWVRVTQGDDRNESIVNTTNIIRIREYPQNKNEMHRMEIIALRGVNPMARNL